MNEHFYGIADAAKILKVKEHNILESGSMGILPIYVCSLISHLFYLKVNTIPDEIEDYPNESEIQAPWDEHARLSPPEHMRLSTTCLKRYCAGDLEAKVIPEADIQDENLHILFGLYDSEGESLKIKDAKLRVLAKDLNPIHNKLMACQALKNSNPNKIDINNVIDSEIDSYESIKNNSGIIKQKDINFNELKQWLFDTWEAEGKPSAKTFFPRILKKYANEKGSPITQVYNAGDDAGISYRLSNGSTGDLVKKTLANYISDFKKISGK